MSRAQRACTEEARFATMVPAGSCVRVYLVCWRLPVCIPSACVHACVCVCVCLVKCALTTSPCQIKDSCMVGTRETSKHRKKGEKGKLQLEFGNNFFPKSAPEQGEHDGGNTSSIE